MQSTYCSTHFLAEANQGVRCSTPTKYSLSMFNSEKMFGKKAGAKPTMTLFLMVAGASLGLNLIEVYMTEITQNETLTFVGGVLLLALCILPGRFTGQPTKKKEIAAKSHAEAMTGAWNKGSSTAPRDDFERMKVTLARSGAPTAREAVVKEAVALKRCVKRDGLSGAAQKFARLEADGITKEGGTFFFSTMLQACASEGAAEKAEEYFGKITEAGSHPDEACYAHLLEACYRTEDLQRAEACINNAEKAGIKAQTLHIGIMDTLIRTGCLRQAEHVLDLQVRMGKVPPSQSYSAVIGAYAQKGDAAKAQHW